MSYVLTKDVSTQSENNVKFVLCEQALLPLPIGFAVFMVHLATIPITGTSINPARSFGPAVIYNHHKVWSDHVCGLMVDNCSFKKKGKSL